MDILLRVIGSVIIFLGIVGLSALCTVHYSGSSTDRRPLLIRVADDWLLAFFGPLAVFGLGALMSRVGDLETGDASTYALLAVAIGILFGRTHVSRTRAD